MAKTTTKKSPVNLYKKLAQEKKKKEETRQEIKEDVKVKTGKVLEVGESITRNEIVVTPNNVEVKQSKFRIVSKPKKTEEKEEKEVITKKPVKKTSNSRATKNTKAKKQVSKKNKKVNKPKINKIDLLYKEIKNMSIVFKIFKSIRKKDKQEVIVYPPYVKLVKDSKFRLFFIGCNYKLDEYRIKDINELVNAKTYKDGNIMFESKGGVQFTVEPHISLKSRVNNGNNKK